MTTKILKKQTIKKDFELIKSEHRTENTQSKVNEKCILTDLPTLIFLAMKHLNKSLFLRWRQKGQNDIVCTRLVGM